MHHPRELTIPLPAFVPYRIATFLVGHAHARPAISACPSQSADARLLSWPGPPVSAFQKRIRGGAEVLRDHICKEMNALNLERCRCIPKNVPGADWRVLQQIVAADPAREKFQVPETLAGRCSSQYKDLGCCLVCTYGRVPQDAALGCRNMSSC